MAPKQDNASEASKQSEADEPLPKTLVSRKRKANASKTSKTAKKRKTRVSHRAGNQHHRSLTMQLQVVCVIGRDMIDKTLKTHYRELRLKAIALRHGHHHHHHIITASDTTTEAKEGEEEEQQGKPKTYMFERCLHGDWLGDDGNRYNRMTVEERVELDQFESSSHREERQREFLAKYGVGHRL
ncbi:hypothetical protein BKA81DRAFT_85569 [Phyllosticta paracitricarpa]